MNVPLSKVKVYGWVCDYGGDIMSGVKVTITSSKASSKAKLVSISSPGNTGVIEAVLSGVDLYQEEFILSFECETCINKLTAYTPLQQGDHVFINIYKDDAWSIDVYKFSSVVFCFCDLLFVIFSFFLLPHIMY